MHTIPAYHTLRDNETNLTLKLSPNENYFTEELVGILTEFKLFKVKFGLRFHAFIQRFGGREVKNELGFLALEGANRGQIYFSLK